MSQTRLRSSLRCDNRIEVSHSSYGAHMPQLTSLVLKDRASTPVNHTFTPRDIRDSVGTVVESTGTPIGNKAYSISLRSTQDGRYKATVKFANPVVQTQVVNGVSTPIVVRTARVTATFDFDSTSSTQERADTVGMFADSLAATQALPNGVLVNLEGVY